jgi:hypothetical protein
MWDGPDPRSDDSRTEISDPRSESLDPRDALTKGLDLPRGAERERVYVPEHRREYHLRGSEVRALATIGTFRVVPASDLRDDAGRPGDVRHGDLERLRSAGLIKTVVPFETSGQRTTLVTLTAQGRDVLESHRARGSHGSSQTYYAGPGNNRELTHNAQLYRAYARATGRLEAGARIERVVLEHELKRGYQRFLQERNRDRAESDGRPDRSRGEIREWAVNHDLPVVNERVQFPDLQIQYERADGRRDVENIEITTVHYRGAHAAGKAAAGFTSFRGRSGRVGGASTDKGTAPFDPHAAEELLG